MKIQLREIGFTLFTALLLVAPARLFAETGANAWLRYAPPPDPPRYHDMPHAVVLLGDAPEERSAAEELDRGLGHMISGTDVLLRSFRPEVDSIVLGTTDALHRARLTRQVRGFHEKTLPEEGFRLLHVRSGARQWWVIQGGSPRAELYGAFRFMAMVAQDRQLPEELIDAPAAPVRWISQWDRQYGTVERGYAGASIFFQDGELRSDLRRVRELGRLLASVGINGLLLGPPAGEPDALSPSRLADAARIAEELRPWGVRLALAINLPLPPPPLGTAENVKAGWQARVDEIYRRIPDFAGFSVTPAPGPSHDITPEVTRALPMAEALGQHGGRLLLRVAGLEAPETLKQVAALDGHLPPNIVLQITEGPSNLGMNTPVSPLAAALRHTSQAMEVQITGEFTGQERETVYLPPMWKELLDTDLRIDGQPSPLRDVVSGRHFTQATSGFVGVANVGMDANWMHHPMALANLYSFGRMAWSPALAPAAVLDEWTRMTWSNDARLSGPIEQMELASWEAWRQNTLPLGLAMQTGEDSSHFGPVPQALAADATTLGIQRAGVPGSAIRPEIRADPGRTDPDRTNIDLPALYPPELAARYGSPATCPENFLLFFHRVPDTFKLRGTNTGTDTGADTGAERKTVLQQIYDAHFAGAATQQAFVDEWEAVEDLVDEERYAEVHALLLYQAEHAEVWRDAINDALLRLSGIPDDLEYVGRHPGRIEAESMAGMGFRTVDAVRGGAASDGKVSVCTADRCSLHTVFQGEPNAYRVEVGYFDRHPGEASYRLLVNGSEAARWKAGNTLPPGGNVLPRGSNDQLRRGNRFDDAASTLNGDTAVRFVLNGVRLKPGDVLTLEGTGDQQDQPAIDFLEITRDPRWN